MADEVQRIEEQNAQLRDQIEQVQQERRAGFAEADEVSRALSAYEENERLKAVLKSQEDILSREQKIRDEMLNDEPVLTADGIPVGTPYTYTPEGPIVSGVVKGDKVIDYTEVDDDEVEADSGTSDSADTDAPSTPSLPSEVSRFIQNRSDDASVDADDADKEN